MKKEKILVAMSGGIDSSVSVFLLQQQNYEVIGIHFILNKDKKDFELARKVAKIFGIQLIIEDISGEFQKKIVNYLIEEYRNNKTPNPCVKCNREIKFDLLKKIAKKYDCKKIATGHYAQIKELNGTESKKCYVLEKAIDETKDQTYYLHRLNQGDLGAVVFPLGGIRKSEVKKIADREGIFFDQKESQDICFISNNEKIEEFLKKNISDKNLKGDIVNDKGVILGKHQGLVYYTIGQRKGLNLSDGPYFVIGKNKKKGELVVSKDKKHPNLLSNEIEFKDVSWVISPPKESKKYLIKTRYQGKGTLGRIFKQEDGKRWLACLDVPQWAPAPGQSLVIYEDKKVVGGGVII